MIGLPLGQPLFLQETLDVLQQLSDGFGFSDGIVGVHWNWMTCRLDMHVLAVNEGLDGKGLWSSRTNPRIRARAICDRVEAEINERRRQRGLPLQRKAADRATTRLHCMEQFADACSVAKRWEDVPDICEVHGFEVPRSKNPDYLTVIFDPNDRAARIRFRRKDWWNEETRRMHPLHEAMLRVGCITQPHPQISGQLVDQFAAHLLEQKKAAKPQTIDETAARIVHHLTILRVRKQHRRRKGQETILEMLMTNGTILVLNLVRILHILNPELPIPQPPELHPPKGANNQDPEL
jgi:hypothetical protein